MNKEIEKVIEEFEHRYDWKKNRIFDSVHEDWLGEDMKKWFKQKLQQIYEKGKEDGHNEVIEMLKREKEMYEPAYDIENIATVATYNNIINSLKDKEI